MATWHEGSACCSRAQSVCEQRAEESPNYNLALAPRASKSAVVADETSGGGRSLERGVATGLARSRPDGMCIVGPGEAAGAGE